MERGFQPGCAIDEKHTLFDRMFLGEFPQESLCHGGISCRKEPNVEEIAVAFRVFKTGVKPVMAT